MLNEITKKHINNRRILASADLSNPEFPVLIESIQRYIDSSYVLNYNPLDKLRTTYPQLNWKFERFPSCVPDRVIVQVASRTDFVFLVNTEGTWRNGVVTAEFILRQTNRSPFICSGPKDRGIWGALVDQDWVNFGDPNLT